MASASATINILDSSDDDQDSIPPSSGLTFRRDNPKPEPPSSRPSHPPPARVSMSTHKKARTSIDTTGASTACGNSTPASARDSIQYTSPFGSSTRKPAAAVYAPQPQPPPQPPPPPPPKKLDTVWLVYHQKEPYYHSAWSYDSNLRFGPSYIDNICVGVYDNKALADAGAKYYWEKQVRKPITSNDADQVGLL
jgi:hypothetical protein